MKKVFIMLTLLVVGCSPSIQMPGFTKQVPDVLAHDTNVIVSSGIQGIINKGTVLQISEQDKVEATLKENTVAKLDGKIVDLPKNTKVFIDPGSLLVVNQSTNIKLTEGGEVVLQKGTTITISKINWYAILFYAVIAVGLFCYFIKLRRKNEDKDNEGYVDEVASKPQLLNEEKNKDEIV